MELQTCLNYTHIAPRKMRLVVAMLRGMRVDDAQIVLRNTIKRSALPVLKLLKSSIASAAHNFQLDESALYIKEIRVDGGPVAKRSMPRAFGRAAAIRKRTSHVVLVLEDRGDASRSSTTKKAKRTREEPAIRSADIADLKEAVLAPAKDKRETVSQKVSRRSAGFARKVFRRKVI